MLNGGCWVLSYQRKLYTLKFVLTRQALYLSISKNYKHLGGQFLLMNITKPHNI